MRNLKRHISHQAAKDRIVILEAKIAEMKRESATRIDDLEW